MGTVRYRKTSWINGIYIVCLLGCIALAVEEFQHEFDLQLYQKNISWIHCPEGWTKIGIECIKVETETTSYDEAEAVCKSFGGHLVKIKGFNLNKVIGETARNVLLAKAVSSTRAWIGFYRNSDGRYMWSDGYVGEEMEGFWAEGQIIQFGLEIKRCGSIETNGSLYGPNRWHLDKCEQKLPFVCQTIPCVEGQFRCADGQKCITQTSRCDGYPDCQDGSDERNCTKGQCIGVLDTPGTTFQSPNFPKPYPSYADCMWKVIAPIGRKVQLNFTSFETEERYDVVKFYDGISTSDDLIGNYSGSVRPDTVISTTNFLLVTFKSDQDVQMSGFSATWTFVTSGSCGGNLTASRKLQWFTSPNYPRNYPHNIICDWVITAPEQDRVVTIQIEDFHVDEPLDWLEVHDRGFEEDDLILLLSGKQTVYRNIVSSGRQIFIRFRTSLKDSSQGFNITYQSGCGILIVRGYGELHSPGYRASSYPNSINCTWIIEDPKGRALTLVFHYFNTEVNFDTVMVFNDSSYSTQAASGPFSGVEVEILIRSSTGHFLINFVSDGQVSRTGWSASFSYDCTSVFPTPNNAKVSQNSSWYGAKINYSCDIGFVIDGPIPRICDIGGAWRTPAPSCSAILCVSPGTVKNGSLVSLTNKSYGGIAEYKCDQGYQIEGNNSILCGTEGWTPLPKCIAINCPKLNVPSKGRLISPLRYTFGARAEFRCMEGYRLIGASYIHCLMNGQWSNNEPTCEPNVTCPELIILHGMVNSSGPVMYRTIIQVTCNPGYKIKGDSNTLTCNEAGDYDQAVPTCQDIDECSQNNRSCGFGNQCINTIGSYWCLCAKGYQHVPGTTNHCLDINECLIDNGACEHICENNNGSYSCNCQSGYHLYEADNITIFDGRILIPGKSCLVSCPAVEIKNGHIFANSSQAADGSFYFPTTIWIWCDLGLVPDGTYVIQCHANGTWSANVTQCIVGMCEQLPNISYGTIDYSDSQNAGSLASYDCDQDYRLEGSRWRICHSGFDAVGMPKYQWTGSEPICASVKWYPPPALSNGIVDYSTTEYGSVANYSCQCGYQLRGATSRTYLQSGLWSNEEIVCVAKTCPAVGAPLNGKIVNQQNIYPVGSLVQYQCKAGFELQDIRPLLCNLDPGSEEGDLPYLHVLINLTLKPSPPTVIRNCMAPYAEKIIANLKPNITQLSAHCEAIVKVLVHLQENYSVTEENVRIKVVLKLQLTLLEHVTQASKGCECAESILSMINRNIDVYIPYLTITDIDNCSAVELNPKKLEEVGKEWKCPANQVMDLPANVQCEGRVPVCQHTAQECKPTLPPLTNIYTSTSSSVSTKVTSVTTFVTTSPTTTDAGTTEESSSTSTSELNSTFKSSYTTTESTKYLSTTGTVASTESSSTQSKVTLSPTASSSGASISNTSSTTSAVASPMSTIKDITNTTATTVSTFPGTETTETKSTTGATYTSLSPKSTMTTTTAKATTSDPEDETPIENITSSTTSLRVSSTTAVSTTLAPATLMTAFVSTITTTVIQGSTTLNNTAVPLTSTIYITYTPTVSSTTTKTSICPTMESFLSFSTYSNSALTSTVEPGLRETVLSQSVTSPGQRGAGGSEIPVFVLQTNTVMSISPNLSTDRYCEKQLNDLVTSIVQSIMNCLIENQNKSCKDGYNLQYLDTHGNITFNNDQMNISVPFKVNDKESRIQSVENCKENIKVILNHTAVTLLATIPAMMNASCSTGIIFNPRHFQITYAKWTCGAGYQYDMMTRLCQTCTDCPTETSPTTFSSLPITSLTSFFTTSTTRSTISTQSQSLKTTTSAEHGSTTAATNTHSTLPSTSKATQTTSSKTTAPTQIPTTTTSDQLPSTTSTTTLHSSSTTITITTQPPSSRTTETTKLLSTATSTQLPTPATAVTTSPPSPTTTLNTRASSTTFSRTTQFQSITPIPTQVPTSIKPTQPSSSTTTTTTQSSSTTSKSTQVPTTTQPTQPPSTIMTSISKTTTTSTGTTLPPVTAVVTSSIQILTTTATTLTTRSTSVCSIDKSSANVSVSIPQIPENIPLKVIAFHSTVIAENLNASCKHEYETSLKTVLYRQQDAVNLEPNINRGCVNASIFINLSESVVTFTMSGNQVTINFLVRLVPSSDLDISRKYPACIGIFLPCALQSGSIFGITEVNTSNASCRPLDLTSTTNNFDAFFDLCMKGTYNNETKLCVEALTTTTQQPFSCYRCDGVSNDTDCTTYTPCSGEQNTCQTEVRYNKGQRKVSITKTCEKNETCYMNKENKNCVSTNGYPVCFYCCHSNLCNNQTVINQEIFKGKSKDAANARKKRSLQVASPAWNSSVPVCRDITPPEFMDCPGSILIEVGHSGLLPVDIKLPKVKDNSGGTAYMNVTYPLNFTSPYLFTQNTTMKIEAYDTNGNKATCNISIIIKDLVPPELICPTEVVYVKIDTADEMVNLDYSWFSLGINRSDAVRLEYSPKPFQQISVLESILVTVKAYDQSSNEAVCNFYLVGLPNGCPDWSLNTPRHGTKSCNYTMDSSNVTCVMTCDKDYRFVDSVTNYTCAQNGTWLPHNHVPDCVGGQHPYQEVFTAWNFSVQYFNSYNNCSFQLDFEQKLRDLFQGNCTADVIVTPSNIDIQIKDTDSGKLAYIESKVQFYSAQRLSSFPCGTKGFLTLQLPRFFLLTQCINLTLLSTSNISSQEACPEGFVKLPATENSTIYCYPCTAGMYASSEIDQCKPCLPGSYQDLVHQTSCKPCPNGTSTNSFYTKNIIGCLEYCGSGFFSKTGLVPCNLCPHGTFQEFPGSRSCVPCPGNTTTRAPGAASQHICSEHCRRGSYSSTGLEPCTPCPRHYYSETPGAITCTECPPGLATALEGTDSARSCMKISFCLYNNCTNNASCREFDRYYTCWCQPGFTGIYCEININECTSNPCVNGGTCQDLENRFRCICPSGYTGNYCEIDVDECASNPCKYGVCQDGSDMFTCICYDGFEGHLCNINRDDCINHQCQNGGQCVDLVGGYTCNCTGTGLFGPHCVNMSSLCNGKLCANGGTCMETQNSFKCQCPQGFYGQFCHMVNDSCASSPCQNGSLCRQSGMKITCECKAGYTGPRCEHDFDDCAKNPCLYGGYCRDLPNGFSCTCADGFTGVLCEEDINNNCANYSCNQTNTLQCQDTGPGFTCTCRPGWKGALCDVEINECQSSPCIHGICQDHLNGYTCTCTEGYAGPNCTEDIDECMSHPCLNRGHCNDGQNQFSCVCQAGFTGNICETDINECEHSPCLNGGSCFDLVNGYYCSCTTLWNGALCEIRINSCTSLPCAQGATCNNTETGFLCHCPQGYTGTICDKEMDECFPNPCQHNGTCVNQLNNYTCYCATGYHGNNCQHSVDHCNSSTFYSCKNGGSCISKIDGPICQCSINFTGFFCEKVKSGSFDLWFFDDSKATSKPPPRELMEISQFSVCLWVRFYQPGGKGTFFTVSSMASNDTGHSTQLLSFHSNGIMVTLFPNVSSHNITLKLLNNGRWHHVCLTWSNLDTGTVQVFLDTSNGSVTLLRTGYGGGQRLHGWHEVEVGQVQLKYGDPLFQGKVSQVNIYSSRLQSETIAAMATSCLGDSYYGNLWSWMEFDICLPDDRYIIRPSSCGDMDCSPGFRGAMCNILIDKSPPVVKQCPSDVQVVSLDRLNQVSWNQPVFSDDVGVARVEQTAHSSGTYSYGEYHVVYTAFDHDGNSANCSFRVYVTPRRCEIPTPPLNGARVCGNWSQGQYCTIKCLGNTDFTEPTVALFKCGKEGFWDPPRGRVFRFPPCAEISDPFISLNGSLTLLGPSCTAETKIILTRNVFQVLAQLSLGAECACNLSTIYVDCPSILQRGRRKRETELLEYKVSFNFTFSSGEVDVAINQLQSYVKERRFDTQEFTLDNNQTVFKKQLFCHLDQVLNFNNKCVNCQPGTYQNKTSGGCELCPLGYYTAKEKQLNCSRCPEGQTTESLGTTSEIDCYSVCSVGYFWDRVTRLCEKCEAGQYQDEMGQTTCKPCPHGKTTTAEGSISIEQCTYHCSLGYEMHPLGGCQPCPKGTYRDKLEQEECQSCPSGFTTKSDGTIYLEWCSIVLCPAGQYRNNNNTCLPCPQGTYQPLVDQTVCLLCGKRQTTPTLGATSADKCINGSVDECLLRIHDCHTEAVCTDLEDLYVCECKQGFTGNGTYCKDNCEGHCGKNMQCYKDSSGLPLCKCTKDYEGLNCEKYIGTFGDLTTGQIAGIVVGLTIGLLILVVWLSLCYLKRKKGEIVLDSKQGVPRLHRSELNSGFPAYAVVHNPTFEASPAGSEDNLGSLPSYYHTDWRRSVYAVVEESDGTWGSKPAFSSEGSLGRMSFF